jgi:hypothetical protein
LPLSTTFGLYGFDATADTLQDGASALLELAKKVAYIFCMLITGCYQLPLTQPLFRAICSFCCT